MTNGTVLTHVRPSITRSPMSKVLDVMGWPVVSISPWVSVRRAQHIALGHEVTHLPVVTERRLAGVVCLCDLWSLPPDARAVDCMTPAPVTIDVHDSVDEAVARMVAHEVGCLPVLALDSVVGVLTRGDLLRAGAVVDRATCVVCGTHHHVRTLYGGVDTTWCCDCLPDRVKPELRSLYEDLGGSG